MSPLPSINRLLSLRGLTNSSVWIEDEAEVWSRATVESQVNTMLTCRRDKDGQALTVDLVRSRPDRQPGRWLGGI